MKTRAMKFSGLTGVLCLLLCVNCGGPEETPALASSAADRAPLNSGLPKMLEGTWAITVDWPVSGAGTGAAMRFLLRAERWVGGWTEQDVIDATELCDVQFPVLAGQAERPRLVAPQAWTPAGVQVAGGTVFYNTRQPETAAKEFHYEPPVIAMGWAIPETLTDERLARRLPMPIWQLESRDNRIDGDGDGQPGVTLVLPGGAPQSIAIYAHFRLESTLTGSGAEQLRAGLNSWPPMAVVILSNQPINLPYLGAAKQTYYGAQSYNVPTTGGPIGRMVRVDAGTACSEIAAHAGDPPR